VEFHPPLPERVFILGSGPATLDGPSMSAFCRIPHHAPVLAVNAAIALPVEMRWMLIVDGGAVDQPWWPDVFESLITGHGDGLLGCARLFSPQLYQRLKPHERELCDGLVEEGRSLQPSDPYPHQGVLRANGTVVASALQLFWNLAQWQGGRMPRLTLVGCPMSGLHGAYRATVNALCRALGACGMVVDSLTETTLDLEVVSG
jgi:hypothetical protein